MKQKNVSIEAFRFIFMTGICLWHLERSIHIQNHGYLSVEFFFMLSGLLLYRSYLRHPEVGVFDYTVRKIKKFWVKYAIAMVPTFFMFYNGIFKNVSADTDNLFEALYSFLLQFTTDILMIRGGIFPPMGNSPTWYISVLLISGAILYAILRNYPKSAINLILPVSCLLIFGYFFPQESHFTIERWNTVNGFSMPLLRGFADMSLGVILLHILQKKADTFSRHLGLLNIASVVSLVCIILLFIVKSNRDVYVILFMPLFLAGLIVEGSCWNRIFKSKVWIFLGSLSYEMLLTHMLIRSPLVYFNVYTWMNPWLMGLLYILVVIGCSYLLKIVGDRLQKRIGWL